MNAPLLIPADIGEAQRQASDPLASAWVSANAGSGKTTVLTQRVIRLLLGETDPGRILCLTFTKAAAAHMANKVFGSLSRWAVLPDEDLAQAIETYEGRSSPQRRRDGARRLFARALETPGGLKVQTIHAFCERLLHQFPFEANVAAAFQVLEDRSAEELLAAIKADVLTQAAAEPRSRLGRALGAIVALAAEATFGELVNEAIGRRHAIADWLSGSTSLDKALARLRAAMGLRDGECCGTIEAQILASPHFDQALWRSAAEAMLASSAQDQDQGRRVRAWLEAQERRRLDAYLSIFLTLDGKPRARLLTKSLAARQELVAQRLADEQNRLLGLLERRKAAVLAEATDALLVIADAIITRYERAKRSRGLLDYDDLIVRAERLLSQGEAAWVLYKLDGGIDHILIDEAQDTNPGQWRVIEALTEEFFAGQGARDEIRTVFAVGDEKQSIFSFQGAEPARFEAMRRHFGDKAQGAQLAFRDVKLRYSFRSTQDILTAVDRVFADPAARQGLSTDGDYREHLAVRHDGPGVVEMWPVFSPVRDEDDAVAWDAPFDVVSETSPAALLAGRVARTIRGWLDRGECLAAKAKPVRAGEILILVRSRNAVFEALIRALKTAQVPVAGADRLVLTEHIAVLDLMALAEFVLLPEDDLTLATLLKSPLIGLDEDALFALCRGRRGTLWRALQEKSAFDPRFRDAYDRLSDWRRRADFVRPYEFFATVLGADEGRRRIYARLGHEAADALDELLNLALAYEATGTPSLQGFLAWLKAARVEVKRDLDLVRDEVRVMTVHNAKGLEADVVF
ncbi:MAG: double-strand break repair helicase AddA, partial [Pseudomonadota bacterium]|nr:double-strand break repair helicase AddA [Pseudomonadota bacterium]